MGEDMLGIASSYSLAINRLVAGYEDGSFTAVVVSDSQDQIIAIRCGKVSDEI
jgi:hypothetical protein